MRTHTIQRKKKFRSVMIIAIIALCAVGAMAYFVFFRSTPVLNPGITGPVKYLIYGKEPVALDQNGQPKPAETDLILIATQNRSKKQLDIISIPPNTLLADGQEIRNIYGTMGAAGLTATVEKVTKEPINYYIGVDYNSFVKLIDQLNGIEVTLGEAINLPVYGLVLEAGISKIDGETALKLLRLKTTSSGANKVQRQESVFRGVYKRLTEINRLSKLKDVTDAVLEVREKLETDIQSEQIIEGFNFLRNGIDKLNISTLPGQLVEDKWVPAN